MLPFANVASPESHPDYARWLRAVQEALDGCPLSRDQLAARLNIGTRTLRRILSGQTQPALSTYLALTEGYRLDPIGLHGQVRLLAPAPGTAHADFDPVAYTDALAAAAAGIGANGRLDVLTVDMPVFYFLESPLLAEWKLRFFTDAREGVTDARFATALERSGELGLRYAALPRREVWGVDPLRGFCHQLERLVAEDRMGLDTARDCFSKLDDMLHELTVQLEDGTSPLQLRVQAAVAGAARYIVHDGNGECRARVSVDSPSFLASATHRTCAYFAAQFEESWQRAQVVSECAQSTRAFFAQQQRVLARRRDRVMASVQ